ncbi:unnamed protein product [Staurois parvus]|uniref:Uncharacterized protein n=1 Tax=Staurois parvus TaxID=386267 RepID=A0ABN9CFI6_9NEOB|nr:unnamed protein product [Staurois parvus]
MYLDRKLVTGACTEGADQGQTDHWGTLALPKGPGSVGGPMRCFFGCGLSVSKDTGAP